MAGRKVKCPACQAVLTVAASAIPPLQPAPGLQPLETPVAAELVPLNPSGAGPMPRWPAAAPLGTAPLNPAFGPPAHFQGAPQPQRAAAKGMPPWFWVATGISGAAAAAAVVFLVIVMVRMATDRRSGNVPDVPTSADIAASRGEPPPQRTADVSLESSSESLPFTVSVGDNLGQWETYTSPDGGYSISLPGKPRVIPKSLDTPQGLASGKVAMVGSFSAGTFSISHLNVPYDTKTVPIDKMIEVSIAMQGGAITQSSDVTMSGRTGKEFVVELKRSSLLGRGIFRALGVEGRVFLLQYVGGEGEFDEAMARKCFDSFVIFAEPPPVTVVEQAAAPTVPVHAQIAWTNYESAKARFKVEFPGPPTSLESGTPTGADSGTTKAPRLHAEVLQCDILSKGSFIVSASELAGPLSEEAVASLTDVLRQSFEVRYGNVVQESRVKQVEAIVYDFVLEDAKGSRTLARRYYGQKFNYDVIWHGPAAESTSSDVQRFFTSFAIVTGSATPAPQAAK